MSAISKVTPNCTFLSLIHFSFAFEKDPHLFPRYRHNAKFYIGFSHSFSFYSIENLNPSLAVRRAFMREKRTKRTLLSAFVSFHISFLWFEKYKKSKGKKNLLKEFSFFCRCSFYYDSKIPQKKWLNVVVLLCDIFFLLRIVIMRGQKQIRIENIKWEVVSLHRSSKRKELIRKLCLLEVLSFHECC